VKIFFEVTSGEVTDKKKDKPPMLSYWRSIDMIKTAL
jgi:hypothetical protein